MSSFTWQQFWQKLGITKLMHNSSLLIVPVPLKILHLTHSHVQSVEMYIICLEIRWGVTSKEPDIVNHNHSLQKPTFTLSIFNIKISESQNKILGKKSILFSFQPQRNIISVLSIVQPWSAHSCKTIQMMKHFLTVL